ncbi:MAG TPA: hypothetical protein PLV42_10005 [bacterium]|nr:hypothetical protein [bacterium]
MIRTLILAMLLAAVIACAPKGDPAIPGGAQYFSVIFAPGTDLGTPGSPLPAAAEYRFSIAVEARGAWGERIADYSGEVEVSLLGAELRSYKRLKLENGFVGPVEVRFANGFRLERIAVEEIAPDKTVIGAREVRIKTGPVGVSAPIYLPYPRISSLQGSVGGDAGDGYPSRLEKRNLTLRGAYDPVAGRYRDMVVVAIIEGGFYLSETDCADFCAVYLYTYSTPYVEDGGESGVLEPGTLIEEVNGSVFEFFGFTELSFPTFRLRRDAQDRIIRDLDALPAPRDITGCLDGGDDLCLESAESSLVTVVGVTVDDFDENEEGWTEYSQFPLTTDGGGIIMAQTVYTAPAFHPESMKGRRLATLTGILKQHTSARPSTWILIPRDSADIVMEER